MTPIPSSPDTSTKADIRVGTSGYSYPEWKDAGIYPKGTKSAEMLNLYQTRFRTVELNYTWYQMAHADSLQRMRDRVDPSFRFSVKLTRTMTHEVGDDWKLQAEQFRRGLTPLIESDQLAAVLIQLPPTFDRSRNNRLYLAHLLDALEPLPLAVEFRHADWAQDQVFAGLEQRKVTLVTVDIPEIPTLFPSIDVVTNRDLFYIRFHGRNARGWRSGSMQHKFDYDYRVDELQPWAGQRIPPMAQQCRKGLLFFNNHVAGQAVRNAETMISLLGRNRSDHSP